MRRGALIFSLLLSAALAAPADDAALAMRELRWKDARATVDGALTRGGLDRQSWLVLARQAAEIAVVLDGAEAAEAEFRKLLVVDPEQPPPTRRGPVVMAPFERARRWVAEHGALKAVLRLPSAASEDVTAIEVRVSGDSLAMVSGARVRVRGANGFSRLPGSSLNPQLPTPGPETQFYIDLVDEHDNVLYSLGGADEPIKLKRAAPPPPPAPPVEKPPPPPPPPRSHALRNATISVGVFSLAFLGVGIGLDLGAVAEFDRLRGVCAPNCTSDQLATFHLERNLAYGAYALAAGGATATLIMMIVQLTRKP
jgi:hypothetical protein